MKKIFIVFLAMALIALAGYFAFRLKSNESPQASVPEQQLPVVSVIKPVVKDVEVYREFTGQTRAVEQVDIVARIAGYLEEINFKDGADVRKGDTLFTIEQASYKAQYEQAQAQVKSKEAELTRAEADLHRFQEAVRNNAVSRQDLTTKQAEYDQAQAAVMASKAALDEAALRLSYTQIKSPIDGRINRNMIDSGNLVGVNGYTVLATVVKLDPMYIYFNVSETVISDIIAQITGVHSNGIIFDFAVMDEKGFPHQGILTYIDNIVDSDTGTILLRGQFDNKKGDIFPGMFTRLKIPVGTKKDALLVEETALCTDIGGKYLLIVDANNMVKRCPVVIGDSEGAMRVIESGISPDTHYINTGLQFIFPGMTVNPQPAHKSADTVQQHDKKII